MIILTILIAAGIHSLILYFLRKKKTFFIQTLISIGVLALLLKVLPPYFLPELDPEGINCGLPVFGVYFVFIIFGLASSITIFMLFLLQHIKNQTK